MKFFSLFPKPKPNITTIILALVACRIASSCNVVDIGLAQLVPAPINSSTTTTPDPASDSIGVICNATIFPDACSQSISSHTDPGSLARNATAHTLVSVALKAASAIVKESHSIAKSCSTKGSQPSLTHLELQAIQDCTTLMDIATDQLDLVIANLSTIVAPTAPSDPPVSPPGHRGGALLDLEAWLSGALSLQSTCADGVTVSGPLASVSSKPGSDCRARILKAQTQVAEVLTNSLDLVKKLASHGDKLSNWKHPKQKAKKASWGRHTLETNAELHEASFMEPVHSRGNTEREPLRFPDWVTRPQRKLLRRLATGPAPLALVPDLIVAKDGSGNFTTITDALANTDPNNYLSAGRRFVMYIKRGVYNETFEVDKSFVNLTFIGDGINVTVITGSNNVGSGNYTTFRTATVGISGVGFWAIDLTFQNTAGPQGYQAVALRASADLAVFYRCGFEGYQDTLYALASRQFYRDCRIYGTVDFIFGNAIACFQNCVLLCRRPLQGQQNTVTAQGRKMGVDISGYSFQNCSVVADSELVAANFTVNSYLGRPWKAYSRTIFMKSFLDSLVSRAGWLSWNSSDPYLDTLYYAEYRNYGPGSVTDGRVDWPGVHVSINYTEAVSFSAESFILGSSWLPLDVITYTSSPSLLN